MIRNPHPQPLIALAAIGLLMANMPALAGPVTYQGSLGQYDIIVELTDDPADVAQGISGRYAYMHQGIDIPLHWQSRAEGALVLAEELACDRDGCAKAAALGATWHLSAKEGGMRLTGQWQGKQLLPIMLERVAERPREEDEAATPQGLADIAERLAEPHAILDARTNPYDYLKLNVALDTRDVIDWSGAVFAVVADPRIGMHYPRIAALPGDAPTDRANAVLNLRHWRYSIGAFSCAALRYAGFRQGEDFWPGEMGTMGGFDWIGTEVTQLTPTLMSWVESGSIWCGGGSPSHFSTPLTMDVERGEILSMTDMFIDWAQEGPGEPIIDLVNARRDKPETGPDAEWEEECGTDDLIGTHLAAYLSRGPDGEPMVTFGIFDLPTVAFACVANLVSLPLWEVGPHMTPEFAELAFGPGRIGT